MVIIRAGRAAIGRTALVLIGAAWVAWASAGAMARQKSPPPPSLEQVISERMNLRGAAVVSLQIPQSVGVPLRFDVPLGAEVFSVRVRPHSVRAPGYRVIEQVGRAWREVKPGPVKTVRGEVDGVPGSVVAGGMSPHGLVCRVALPDGRDYWIEPLASRVPGAPKGRYVVYTHEHLVPGGWVCDTDAATDRTHPRTARQGGAGGPAPRGGVRYSVQIATDADFEYFAAWGGTSNVNDRIETVINAMHERAVRAGRRHHLHDLDAGRPHGRGDAAVHLDRLPRAAP